MKIRILWALVLVWALLFLNLAFGRLGYAWYAEGSIFNMGQKLEAFLAGIGAISVGLLPVYLTYRLHRFHKSRERHRLQKERRRIDKRIDKLDRRKSPTAPVKTPIENGPLEAVSS